MDGATVLNYKWAANEPIQYTNWDHGEPGASMRCVFPFKYKAREYNECITDKDDPWYKIIGGPWCSGTADFGEDHRFIPCDDEAFFQDCAIMNKESGKWFSDWGEFWQPSGNSGGRGCYDKQNYVCDKMKDGKDRPVYVPRPPTEGENCEGDFVGWQLDDDAKTKSHDCYKVISFKNSPQGNNSQGLMFTEAEAYCREYGANLVSLHNLQDEEQLFSKIIKSAETISNDWYWLGFNDRGSDGYRWTDGSADDYTNWAAGQPEKSAKAEECSEILSSDAQNPAQTGWYSDYCNQQRGVICQLVRGRKPEEPPTIPPPVMPDTECQNLGGVDETWYGLVRNVNGADNKLCIMAVSDSPDYQYGAEATCVQKGGNLLSIHSREEMEIVSNIMR